MALGFEGMGALDPSGFQISVVVINPSDGVRIPLWTRGKGGDTLSEVSGTVSDALSTVDSALGLMGGSGSGSVDLMGLDLPIVEGVTLELSLGMIAKTAINIAAPFDLGLKLLESSLFKVGNLYEVQLGYPKSGRFTPWFVSTAQKPSIRITGDEGLSGTLNGDGGGMAAIRGQSAKVYEGKSYREIIEEIAETHKWGVVFKDEASALEMIAAVGLGGEEHPLDKTRATASQRNLSDWFFIQKMCIDAGCDAFLAPDKSDESTNILYIKRRKESLSRPPLYKFIMRGNADFSTAFPMFDFEIEPVGVYLPGGAVKTTSSDVDPLSKKRVDVEATAETSDEAALGEGKVPTSSEKDVEGKKIQLVAADGNQRTGQFMNISARDPRGAPDVCQATRNILAFRGGVNANISSYAIPELFPGSIVELAGVGVFNSNYWVESMTHTASDTEWTMSLKLVNNGSASGGLEDFLSKQSEKKNTEEVEEGVEAASGASSIVDSVEGGK